MSTCILNAQYMLICLFHQDTTIIARRRICCQNVTIHPRHVDHSHDNEHGISLQTRIHELIDTTHATQTLHVFQRLTPFTMTRYDQIHARGAEGLLIVQKRTKNISSVMVGIPPKNQDTAAALSLAAHPKLRSSRLLLLLRQKFGLLGLLGLLLLLLLQHGGGGGDGAAGGTSSSRNAALLGALGAGDRKQSKHFAVVAVAVTVAAVVATAVAAAEVLVLLQSC